ncbi:MAG: glycoside hydrolase family 3 C-terminal domain-containing protein [Bacteroidia bacterium]|nr:glycoside hydrolase family 3 C-terminal domain-containing protein [Bacteroidia bacterium]
MNKFFKIFLYFLGALIIILIGTYLFFTIKWNRATAANMKLLGDSAPSLTIDGYTFRDLNKNGGLDIYEDTRASVEDRIDDLLGQMNLEEKAGLMFINMIGMDNDGGFLESPIFSEPISFVLPTNTKMVARLKMNHFNIVQSPSEEALAKWNNNIQKLAERTRLGIPVTIATDPRHVAANDFGATIPTPFFSKWCSPLGFAAIGDTVLMHEFGDIARQEYLAVGIRLALHPMADLATEPRWGRIGGTFGEDAFVSAALTKAYVLGFQGDSLNHESVACMTKHFSGAGPQKDGEDAHFPYGKEQVYPGDNFDYHLIPFTEGAFPAKTAQIMPYYGIPIGQTPEDVAMAYNEYIITDLLRDSFGFEGVVCTDWNIVTEASLDEVRAWGVEHLTESQRISKLLEVGCDMFGGESRPDLIIDLVQSGEIQASRIDQSIRRILRDKFILGLFDNPFVNIDDLSIVGSDQFNAKGRESQRRSLVLLKNNDDILPLSSDLKIYIEGIDNKALSGHASAVKSADEADIIIKKLKTPFTERNDYFIEQFFRQGQLNFTQDEISGILDLSNAKPTIIIIDLERPAVFPEINDAASSVIASFNSSDEIIIDMIFGAFSPTGKLPFQIPSSVEAVEAQLEDVPYDSKDPLYPFGHGLSYQ